MTTIETIVTVGTDGQIQITWPPNLPPGQHKVVITLAEPEVKINFTDLTNHWAKPFVEGLAARRIVSGFPDGTFRPDETMTRAQFAAVVSNAFRNLPNKREAIAFADVPTQYWAKAAIERTFRLGLLSGFSNQEFRPEAKVTSLQIILSLVNGLKLTAAGIDQVNLWQVYQDWQEIPDFAIPQVATATLLGLVVDGDNSRTLRPFLPATRGEVAAFIYQALAEIGQVPRLNSNLIVTYPPADPLPPTVQVSHQREFRGVWVAGIWNINWPSRRGLPTEVQKSELLEILDQIQNLNLNALVLQVRPEGDAFYPSQLEPWSAWLTGTQGQPPNPFYDPLEFAIAEGHKRGIEIHAWFNPYRARTSSQTSPLVKPHLAAVEPSAVYQYGNQQWMDPGLKVVQDRTYNVIMDVLRRYDVDGIHLDDYFYPYPIPGKPFPDSNTYNAYKSRGGQLSLGDWRRNNVNEMVKRLATGISSTKPHVRFGISPFGIYRPGQPPGITGLDQYGQLYADPKKWLAEGWVDYLAPQLYWPINQRQQSYSTLLKWWVENNPRRKHIYAGNNLAKLEGNAWQVSELEQQVKLTRNLSPQLALGNIYYNMKPFSRNYQGVNEKFRQQLYPEKVLLPTIPDRNTSLPLPPGKVEVKGKQITWQAQEDNLKGWTLYLQTSAGWQLERVLPQQVTQLQLSIGTYALCAVNLLSEESSGVLISVS